MVLKIRKEDLIMQEYRELASRYYAHLEMIQHEKEITLLDWNGHKLTVRRYGRWLSGRIYKGFVIIKKKTIKELDDLASIMQELCEM